MKNKIKTNKYEDAFFIKENNQTVTWLYYNPDSFAGGQYVTNTFGLNEVLEAAKTHKSSDDFFDYIGSMAYQTLADVDTEWFAEAEKEFLTTPDYMNCTQETMNALIELAKMSLAEQLVNFIKDFDFYDYIDCLEIGETAEDAVSKTRKMLNNQAEVAKIIEYLSEINKEETTLGVETLIGSLSLM